MRDETCAPSLECRALAREGAAADARATRVQAADEGDEGGAAIPVGAIEAEAFGAALAGEEVAFEELRAGGAIDSGVGHGGDSTLTGAPVEGRMGPTSRANPRPACSRRPLPLTADQGRFLDGESRPIGEARGRVLHAFVDGDTLAAQQLPGIAFA